MKVRYTPRARRDLVEILDYIDQRSPSGARNVKRALQRSIELIGDYPNAGRPYGEEQIRLIPVARYPYLVFWTVDRNDVWRVHIRHAACTPWQERK